MTFAGNGVQSPIASGAQYQTDTEREELWHFCRKMCAMNMPPLIAGYYTVITAPSQVEKFFSRPAASEYDIHLGPSGP